MSPSGSLVSLCHSFVCVDALHLFSSPTLTLTLFVDDDQSVCSYFASHCSCFVSVWSVGVSSPCLKLRRGFYVRSAPYI